MPGARSLSWEPGSLREKDGPMTAVNLALNHLYSTSNDYLRNQGHSPEYNLREDEITMGEIGDIIENLQEKAGQEANIIWGNGI
jgi:cell division protein FtsZ